MKMLKKLMAVALAGVMALVVLTGCASKVLDTKEIIANMNDSFHGYTLEDAGDADAVKAATILKELKGKEEHKDDKIDALLNCAEDELTKALVAKQGVESVEVTYAELQDFKSTTMTEAKSKLIAMKLSNTQGIYLDDIGENEGNTGKISMTAEQIGEKTYVIAVIRTAAKK